MKVLPAIGDISSSVIREKLARGEEVKGLHPAVLEEINKRGLYEIKLPSEARIVRKWIYEKIAEWETVLDTNEVRIELGGSLVSGLFVSEGANKYDADVKFIVKNPEDPEILRKIEVATGLRYRKTINIRELPPEKNTATLMEKVFEIPGVEMPVDVEGLVRQGPYINSHKLVLKVLTLNEQEEVRRKKRELRDDKEAYKKYKYEIRDGVIRRAKETGLIVKEK